MMVANNVNINGFQIRASQPLSPERRKFLEDRGCQVVQANGKVHMGGHFNLKADSIKRFLSQ